MRGSRGFRDLDFWPEAILAICWIALFLLTDFVFRDDESVLHRAAHLGLWLSLACYAGVALWSHWSTDA